MRYYYLDSAGNALGPYTSQEMRQLHLSGQILGDTQVRPENSSTFTLFREVWPSISSAESAKSAQMPPIQPQSPPPKSGPLDEGKKSLIDKIMEDLRMLRPHFIAPFTDLQQFRWLENRKLLGLAAVGLLPLAFQHVFHDFQTMLWALALYFTVLWALFFRWIFDSPDVDNRDCIICFISTAVLGILFAETVQQFPPWSWLYGRLNSTGLTAKLIGFVFGVGITEELAKALVLFYFARRTPTLGPRLLLFYGLISGLGFGIHEGVGYQTHENLSGAIREINKLTYNDVDITSATKYALLDYYVHNLSRLTSLPFLHAMWAGIAGYFIGMANLHPSRKHGLLVGAIGIPALLHGFYDTFSESIFSLVLMLLSVTALVIYLAKSRDLDAALSELSGRPPLPEDQMMR